jgi:hypothetical protein
MGYVGNEDSEGRLHKAWTLSPIERWMIRAISGLALLAILVTALSSLRASLNFFGVAPTVRESAINGHTGRAFLWALTTPFCAWAVLRGGRRALLAAALWLALLAWCSPWWWPPPPQTVFDTQPPLWFDEGAAIAWSLVAAGLAVGLYRAWRYHRWPVRTAAIVVALIIIVGGIASYLHLADRSEVEEGPRISSAAALSENQPQVRE